MPGYAEASKAIDARTSPRAKYLATLERYIEGTQYAGMADWFDRTVPLFKRAPCIVYTLAKSAIDSNVDFVLGESRWPRTTSRPSEDDSVFDDLGLDQEASAVLDKFILEAERQCRFRSVSREIFAAAQGCGTAVGIFGVRLGQLFIDTTKARWCTPVLDIDGSVLSLTIEYPYLEQYQEPGGTWKVRPRLYRRVIDAQRDVTFLPADASINSIPKWQEDPQQTFNHGLGFCPVIWYAFMRGASGIDKFDGRAIHAHLLDEIRALDMALSMRHRAALYAGDPQWTETGVEPGYVPTEPGEIISIPATAQGGLITSENQPTGEYRQPKKESGRKKGPGEVWQYESPDVKVQLHTLPGDAFTSINEHIKDLRVKLGESLSVVFLDLEAVKFASALSGKALDILRERQLDRCEQYRDDFGTRFLLPALGMLLRIVTKMFASLKVSGIKQALPILAKFDLEQWLPPSLSIIWGPFFRPDIAEQQLTVAMVVQAGHLITRSMGLEKLKTVFPFENVDLILKQLEEEAQERAKGDLLLSTTAQAAPSDTNPVANTKPTEKVLDLARREVLKDTKA